MSKTSGLSTEKSIREKFDELVSGCSGPTKGWKTKNQWCNELKIGNTTFVNRIATLLNIGKAKKQSFHTKTHGIKVHYWIDTLS